MERTNRNLDASFFLKSNDSNKYHERYSQLQIVKREDLVPLYKILPKPVQNDIEEMISDRYHIIMTGIATIKRENQTYVNIRFAQPNQDSEDEMFGNLIDNGQKYINNQNTVGTKIFWIMLAKRHGSFSKHTRYIKIIHGKETFSGQLPLKHSISTLNEFPDSFIFVTCLDSEDLSENQVIRGIEHHSKTSLILNISQYNEENIQLDNVIMRWYMISTNHKDYVTTDVGTELLNWSVLGEVLTAKIVEPINEAPKNTNNINMIDLFEEAIRKDNINYFNYNEFSNFERINDGGFSIVTKS
ncbi:hypothetical protein F8M41_007265 [Gigaspora margarita]|uniref:Uncharacterized protein n=1 Tax=Gigaspora margarita TaxID=4874 RepID=A0A8H3X5A3_GIGMA|nr:hypothetical protein F8M41_007265 [Gigaspora margarita]